VSCRKESSRVLLTVDGVTTQKAGGTGSIDNTSELTVGYKPGGSDFLLGNVDEVSIAHRGRLRHRRRRPDPEVHDLRRADRSFAAGTTLNQPRMAEVNAATRELWLVNARAREIIVFDVDGRVVRRFGSQGSGNGQFNGDPRGIAINPASTPTDTRVFVSDVGNHRMQVFNGLGAFVGTIGGASPGTM
jgi:hypothetical protein